MGIVSFLPHVSCIMHHVPCIVQHVSCIMHHVSAVTVWAQEPFPYILLPASIQRPRLASCSHLRSLRGKMTLRAIPSVPGSASNSVGARLSGSGSASTEGIAARRIHMPQPKWSSRPPQPLAQPQPAPAPAAAAARASSHSRSRSPPPQPLAPAAGAVGQVEQSRSRSRSRSRAAVCLDTIQATLERQHQQIQELESEVQRQRTRIHQLESELVAARTLRACVMGAWEAAVNDRRAATEHSMGNA